MSERRVNRWAWLWGACYIALMIAVVWSLYAAKHWVLAEAAQTRSNEDWEAWRQDVVQQQEHPGPVQRRVPMSVEPPAIVLMRDYFGVSLAGALVFTSVLFWVIAWMVTGALSPVFGEDARRRRALTTVNPPGR